MKNPKIKTLAECAIFIALGTVLSIVIIYEAPLGGSVTLFSMVPVIMLSFRHGAKWGIASAFCYSVLQLLLGMKNVMYVPGAFGIVLCVLLDYIIAFTVLGLAGIFMNIKDAKMNHYVKIICGTLAVCILRYASHVVSGAIVWYEITKEGAWNDLVLRTGMWTYSLIYNAQYMLPETIITLIGIVLIMKAMTFIKPTGKKA